MPNRLLVSVALAALVALPGAAIAAPRGQNFDAHLTGGAEVPSRDTPATGQATFHLSGDGSTITYRLVASNIENVFAAHIHCPAAEGDIADPIVLLATTHQGQGNEGGVNSNGTFAGSTLCDDGETTVLEAMRAGNAYVNVHTNDGTGDPNTGPGDFQTGEIRGQIEARGPAGS